MRGEWHNFLKNGSVIFVSGPEFQFILKLPAKSDFLRRRHCAECELIRSRWIARLLLMAGLAVMAMPGTAFAADVRVMISAGFYQVYAELAPAFERASGHHLITT